MNDQLVYDLVNFHLDHATTQNAVQPIAWNTAHDIQIRSGLPWLPLQLPFTMPYEAMLAEAQALREHFVPHRSYKEHNRGWYSLCLHGLSSVHTGPRDRYHTDLPYAWTDICRFCPITHGFFRDVFGYHSYARVRFMLVEAGGYVLPHSDSIVDELTTINIALNTPDDCDFVMEGAGTVPLMTGKAVLLSLSRRHIVWNQSSEDRYHIIVHGQRDAAIWDDIIINSAKAYNGL